MSPGGNGEGIAAQIIGVLVNARQISRPLGNKVKFRCGNFSSSSFSDDYSTESQAQIKNPCSSGFPEVSINTGSPDYQPRSGKLKSIVFHEFLHLTGRAHIEDQVDSTYMCQYACFSDSLPLPEGSNLSESQVRDQAQRYCDGQDGQNSWDETYAETLGAVSVASGAGGTVLAEQLAMRPTKKRINRVYEALKKVGGDHLRRTLIGNPLMVLPWLGVGSTETEVMQIIYSIWVEDDPNAADIVQRDPDISSIGIITEQQFLLTREALVQVNSNDFEERLLAYRKLTQLENQIAERILLLPDNTSDLKREAMLNALRAYQSIKFSGCVRDRRAARSRNKIRVQRACVEEE